MLIATQHCVTRWWPRPDRACHGQLVINSHYTEYLRLFLRTALSESTSLNSTRAMRMHTDHVAKAGSGIVDGHALYWGRAVGWFVGCDVLCSYYAVFCLVKRFAITRKDDTICRWRKNVPLTAFQSCIQIPRHAVNAFLWPYFLAASLSQPLDSRTAVSLRLSNLRYVWP